MNAIIAEIQARRERCGPETWSPEVSDAATGFGNAAVQPAGRAGSCLGSTAVSLWTPAQWAAARIGDTEIPRSLHDENDEKMPVRNTSGRDSGNNIIVYWSDAARRPTDGAKCWFYVARLRIWEANH